MQNFYVIIWNIHKYAHFIIIKQIACKRSFLIILNEGFMILFLRKFLFTNNLKIKQYSYYYI